MKTTRFCLFATAAAAGWAIAQAPGASKPEKGQVTIKVDGDYRYIKSNGWPDHTPGQFPRRGNPNAISTQDYSFRVPVKPTLASQPTRMHGWWGVAVNGVPFEPGTAETWNNDPSSGWRYEAGTGFLNLGLDENNAHVQPNGSYHYHAMPTGLVEKLGGDGKSMLLVGWAADGYPLYTSWAHVDAKDGKSTLRQMKSSYKLKKGTRPAEPTGPGGSYDGRFTQDFEYVQGAGDLDENNGRTGVTPEFPEGTYYYCLTTEFPFVPRKWHGVPDPSFEKRGGPGGPGGPGGSLRPAPLGGAPRGIMEGPGYGKNGRPEEGAEPPRPAGGEPPQWMGRPEQPPAFAALDANRDGVIDADELKASADALKKLDKNGDGKITMEEFRPGPPGRGGRPGAERPPR